MTSTPELLLVLLLSDMLQDGTTPYRGFSMPESETGRPPVESLRNLMLGSVFILLNANDTFLGQSLQVRVSHRESVLY